MKLILLKDVAKLGQANTLVEVKPGYARNFLLPQGLAKPAISADIKRLEIAKQRAEELKAKVAEEAKQIAQKLKDLKLSLEKKASKTGSLYAAVSESEVTELLEKEAGIKLNPEMLKLPETIKEAGEYKILVKLSEETEGHFKLLVKS